MVTVSAAGGGSGFAFSIPDGARAGDTATMDWFFQHPHSGWIFLENISGGPNPDYTVSGTGQGTPNPGGPRANAPASSDFAGTSGTSTLTLQSSLSAGQTYRIKTYLNDGSFGTANETSFVALDGPGGSAAAATVSAPGGTTNAAAVSSSGSVGAGSPSAPGGNWFSQNTAGIPNWVLALGGAVIAAEML